MARSYTMLDLIRFANFSKENEGTKPIDRIKAYNAKYPELSAKQKWENIRKYLGDELGDEIELAMAKRSDEKRALTLADVSQQRELFNAILDFTEDLPLVSEDYNRDELWEQFRALNCG